MKTRKNEKFLYKWQKVQSRGKNKYVRTNSKIMGLVMFAGFIMNKLIKGNTLDQKIEFTRSLGILFGGLLGGAIGGMISWSSKEKKYNDLINKDK